MDWNDGATLSKSKSELLHIMVLEICYNLEQTINSYYCNKSLGQNCSIDLAKIKGYLIEFECRLLTPMDRNVDEFKKRINDILTEKNIDNLLNIYHEYETYLYHKGLTKWDNIKQKVIKDPFDPEEFIKEEKRARA